MQCEVALYRCDRLSDSKTHLSDSSYPVRLKYRDPANTVRVGRLLEDFDSMAVATSYKHNEQLARAKKSTLNGPPFERFRLVSG